MADEQGLDVPEGWFARSTLGASVKQFLATIGPDGRQFTPLDAAPDNPENGDTYLADGSNWDPAGTGNAALATYVDGDWEVVNEFSTGL